MINVAVLWLVNELGEVLLAQRSYQKANEPGVWGPTMTGKLEPGETFDQGLRREVQEEIGLKPTDYEPHFLRKQVFDHPDGTQRMFAAYYARFPKGKTAVLKLQATEVEGVRWYSVAEIEAWMRSRAGELVPSANAVWPATFRALRAAGALDLTNTLQPKAQSETP